jgi:hypothetical protein
MSPRQRWLLVAAALLAVLAATPVRVAAAAAPGEGALVGEGNKKGACARTASLLARSAPACAVARFSSAIAAAP